MKKKYVLDDGPAGSPLFSRVCQKKKYFQGRACGVVRNCANDTRHTVDDGATGGGINLSHGRTSASFFFNAQSTVFDLISENDLGK